VCTYVTNRADVAGSALIDGDWRRVDRAVVYFDHPQDLPAEHALCIDVWGDGCRAAVELDAASARRLAETILATLESDEVKVLV
jgi:hypothetical protein